MHAVETVSSITTMEAFRNASPEEQKSFLTPLAHKLSDKQIAELLGSTEPKDANYIGLVRRRLKVLYKGRGWHLRKENRERFLARTNGAARARKNGASSGFEVRLSGSFSPGALANQLEALRAMVERINRESTFAVTIAVEETAAKAQSNELAS